MMGKWPVGDDIFLFSRYHPGSKFKWAWTCGFSLVQFAEGKSELDLVTAAYKLLVL